MSGPSTPDSWLDRLQHSAFALLFTAIALVVAWHLLRQLLVPLVAIAVLVVILRLAVGRFQRSRWQ